MRDRLSLRRSLLYVRFQAVMQIGSPQWIAVSRNLPGFNRSGRIGSKQNGHNPSGVFASIRSNPGANVMGRPFAFGLDTF